MPFAFVCIHTFLCKEFSSNISSIKIQVIFLTVLHLENLLFERSNTPPQLPKIRLLIQKNIILYTVLTYVTVLPHYAKNSLKVTVQMQHLKKIFSTQEQIFHTALCATTG